MWQRKLTEERGVGGRGCNGPPGRTSFLEGSADGATLERLGGSVVVHHAALGLALSGEEQLAEFLHLRKRRRSRQSFLPTRPLGGDQGAFSARVRGRRSIALMY